MKNLFKNFVPFVLFLGLLFSACENELDLPGEGSITDETPPVAGFSIIADADPNNFSTFVFSNESTSANEYLWDYGDGSTSTEITGANVYAEEGTYTITLTASDALGVVSTVSADLEVIEPEISSAIVPVIQAPGFENGVDYPCSDRQDARDCWRSNSDFGGILQQTQDPVNSGDRAGKFPSSDDRVGYQDGITLTPNTDYELVYFYNLFAGDPATLTVAIIADGTYATLADAQAATIGFNDGSDQSNPDGYSRETLVFNSGANNAIGILITKVGAAEGRMDDFTLRPL